MSLRVLYSSDLVMRLNRWGRGKALATGHVHILFVYMLWCKPPLNGPKTLSVKSKQKWEQTKKQKRTSNHHSNKRSCSSVVCSQGGIGGYGSPPDSARRGFQLKPGPPNHALLTTDQSVLWFTGEFESRHVSTQTYLGLSLRF